MHIYAMRHGESEYNVLGLCNDDPRRNVRLTETGRLQAKQAAEIFRRIPLDKIFCSQLPRARETAKIIAEYHEVKTEIDARLDDIRTGCDGKPVVDYFRLTAPNRLNARVGDGETLLEYKRRVMNFLDGLGNLSHCRNVLLVAHEETLRIIAAHDGNLSDETMMGLKFGNCEIIEFDL